MNRDFTGLPPHQRRTALATESVGWINRVATARAFQTRFRFLIGSLKMAPRVDRCLDFILSQLGLSVTHTPGLPSRFDIFGNDLVQFAVGARPPAISLQRIELL
jgi:hypothetical protein